MSTQYATCQRCGIGLVAQLEWAALSIEMRADARRAGYRPHDGRGLCQPCYQRAGRTGSLIDYERTTRDADTLLADWEMLRDDGYTVRQAAERLGVTHDCLDKALERAKRRGDQRGERHAFGRVA